MTEVTVVSQGVLRLKENTLEKSVVRDEEKSENCLEFSSSLVSCVIWSFWLKQVFEDSSVKEKDL